jgi:hypothetical protein
MALKFGYWMPLGSGGFVISNIKQRTDWSLDYNAKRAQTLTHRPTADGEPVYNKKTADGFSGRQHRHANVLQPPPSEVSAPVFL